MYNTGYVRAKSAWLRVPSVLTPPWLLALALAALLRCVLLKQLNHTAPP